MIKFGAFLRQEEKEYQSFSKELSEIFESLDTVAEITKVEHSDGFDFYYFDINDKKFRVILEKVQDETGINFEQEINGKFVISGIAKNLSAKEALSLFSTVMYVVKKYSETDFFSVFTDDVKKFRLYNRILLSRGAENVSYNSFKSNGKTIVQIQFSINSKTLPELLNKTIRKFRRFLKI